MACVEYVNHREGPPPKTISHNRGSHLRNSFDF